MFGDFGADVVLDGVDDGEAELPGDLQTVGVGFDDHDLGSAEVGEAGGDTQADGAGAVLYGAVAGFIAGAPDGMDADGNGFDEGAEFEESFRGMGRTCVGTLT